ncbi:hypothetical protein ACO0QE_004577 [Hanseniaspora vineae]
MIAKRALSTLIPPKIASPQNLTGGANNKLSNVIGFYKALPQGPAPAAAKPSGFIGKYKANFFDGENASGKPLWHLAVGLLTLGYTIEYVTHLKHHKGEEH